MRKSPLFIALLLMPGLALAHPGHLEQGFTAGLTHPFNGLDHLLAMLAVGLWAGHIGGRARWQLPLTFVGVMLLGGAAGLLGIEVAWLETGIAGSVLVLGLLVALTIPLSSAHRNVLVGGFAFLHGMAHAAELPVGAGALSYFAAFTISTAALHGLGLALAIALPQRWAHVVRWAGAAVGLAGGFMLLG